MGDSMAASDIYRIRSKQILELRTKIKKPILNILI